MMRNGSLKQTLKLLLSVCLVCSFLVSAAAVMLHARQKENQHQDRIKNILIAAGLYRHGIDSNAVYRQSIKPVLIDLSSGEQVDADIINAGFNLDDFDIEAFANDPALGETIAAEADSAKIERRPKYMAIYYVETAGQVDKLILPVFGKGLWSTIYGFLALDKDLQTITGITFYRHSETPGLGGEIDNPGWKKQWQGKQAFDSEGRVIIEVIRGEAVAESPDAGHQIDGLAGATLTSRGVNRLLHYWLGDEGYGALLARLRQELKIPKKPAGGRSDV